MLSSYLLLNLQNINLHAEHKYSWSDGIFFTIKKVIVASENFSNYSQQVSDQWPSGCPGNRTRIPWFLLEISKQRKNSLPKYRKRTVKKSHNFPGADRGTQREGGSHAPRIAAVRSAPQGNPCRH